MDEAVSLLNENATGTNDPASEIAWDLGHQYKKAQWKVGMLAIPAALETVYWGFWACRLILEAFKWSNNGDGHAPVTAYEISAAVILTITWIYALLRPFFLRKPLIVPYDLFTLYLSFAGVTGLNVGSIIYKEYTYGSSNPPPPTDHGTMVALMLHVFILAVLISVTLSLPIGIPPDAVDQEKIGTSVTPEDYTKLAHWITFWWIYPIVKRVCPNLTL